MSPNVVVHIIDDEPIVCEALAKLLEAAGLATRCHLSAELFYQSFDATNPGCIIVDVCMPGMSGLSLQEKLIAANVSIPIIILTGHADVPMAVEAMAKGAIGFLQKPPRSHELLDLVMMSVEWHAGYLEQLARLQNRLEKFKRLTEREREILGHVVNGKPSKEIAKRFGISQRTVEQHRSNVMHKLKVESLADLVRLSVESPENSPKAQFRESLRAQMSSSTVQDGSTQYS
jgi:two-component system, LuxR family, response regulator FixJ